MDFTSYPQTVAGLLQAMQDFYDDYSMHQHDGTSTRQFDTIRANGASLRALSIQKTGFGDTTNGLWAGLAASSFVAQFYLGNATNFVKWDGTSMTIAGALSAGSIDIPDTTTANSFHTDSSGNSWWGSNIASGYAGANAYVLNTGAAVFKSIQMGGNTVQYVISNSGIFSYGDGSDGDATISVNTTLSSDKYYRNLTVNSGAILILGQYRLFCSQSLTLSGNAVIKGNGNAGGNGSSGNRGANGAAVAAGYFLASAVGAGASGVAGNTTHSLGSNGGIAGSGAGAGSGGPTAVGTATASSVKLIANWHLATLLDITAGVTALFTGGGGGASGGFGLSGTEGGGGGGSAGAIIAIYAKTITINSGSSITATGGAGGNGSVQAGGGGGGGGGGAGGIIVLVYNALTNSGSITANGGAGGTGGGGGAGDGSTGGGGTIYQFMLSL